MPLRAGGPPPGARAEGATDQRRGAGGGEGGKAGDGREAGKVDYELKGVHEHG